MTIVAPPGAKCSRHSQDPHNPHVHFSPFVIVRHDTPLSPLSSRFKKFVAQPKPKKPSRRRPRGEMIPFNGGAMVVALGSSSQSQSMNTQAIESIDGDLSFEVDQHDAVAADASACIDSPETRLSDPDHIIPDPQPTPSEVSRDMPSEKPASVELSTDIDFGPSESSLHSRLPASDPAASPTSSPSDHPNSGTITHTPIRPPPPTDSNSWAPAEDGPQMIMASMEGGVKTLWKVLSQVHGDDFDAVMVDTCEGLVLALQQLQGKYRAAIADKSGT